MDRLKTSLYCFYNTIEKNETPPETDTLDVKFVDDVIKGIWGTDIKNLKDHDIYAYQYHGPALLKHLKSMGAATSGYKYGIFEKDTSLLTSQKGVNMNTTNVYDDIWEDKGNKLLASDIKNESNILNCLPPSSSAPIQRNRKSLSDHDSTSISRRRRRGLIIDGQMVDNKQRSIKTPDEIKNLLDIN